MQHRCSVRAGPCLPGWLLGCPHWALRDVSLAGWGFSPKANALSVGYWHPVMTGRVGGPSPQFGTILRAVWPQSSHGLAKVSIVTTCSTSFLCRLPPPSQVWPHRDTPGNLHIVSASAPWKPTQEKPCSHLSRPLEKGGWPASCHPASHPVSLLSVFTRTPATWSHQSSGETWEQGGW